MNVLFANPPWWERSEWKWGCVPVRRAGVRAGSRWPYTYPTLSFPGWRAPFEYLPLPFFMTFAAAYVAKHTGAQVTVRDSIARRESYRAFEAFVKAGRFDFIFIESASPSWPHDRELLLNIHRWTPEAKLVVCGPITIEQAPAILESLPVTACIKGEYEKGALAVVNGKTGIVEHDLLTAEEMNAAPWPMYDAAVATHYFDRNPRGARLPQAQVWGSRGCPFKCIFCVWPATMTGNDPEGTERRTVRYYTGAYMEALLKHLIERYRYRSIYFDDDTFNLGTRHTRELCAVLRKIGLPWAAMCRADTIRMPVWQEMRDSGCYGVKIGFESGNQEVVDQIVNKSLDLGYAAEVVRHLRKIGLTVHGTFTIGLPGETPEQMRQTIDFARALPFNSLQISGTAEIEGSPLHRLRQKGTLESFKGAKMDAQYDRASDGLKKAQRLVEHLRND